MSHSFVDVTAECHDLLFIHFERVSELIVFQRQNTRSMILIIIHLVLFVHSIDTYRRDRGLLMPGVPVSASPSPSSISFTRQVYTFADRTFTRIDLFGGPFNVRLYQNPHPDDNYTSVDVETDELMHKGIHIDVVQDQILLIRMNGDAPYMSKSNITLTITYRQLNELHIDGTMNIRCLNRIRTDQFRLHHHGMGTIKLKLDGNTLDAYLHSIGLVQLCGQVKEQVTIKTVGVGDVRCRSLLTKKIHIISAGIGNIFVRATEEINIILSGISTVYYAGPLKQQIRTGSGHIVETDGSISTIDQRTIDTRST